MTRQKRRDPVGGSQDGAGAETRCSSRCWRHADRRLGTGDDDALAADGSVSDFRQEREFGGRVTCSMRQRPRLLVFAIFSRAVQSALVMLLLRADLRYGATTRYLAHW
jgi:hypothetical protein